MSEVSKTFREWADKARKSLAYKVAKAQSDFAYRLEDLMGRRGRSRKQLAADIGSSPAYITKIMSGDANFTIETMVKVLDALDADLIIRPKPREIHLARTWSKADTIIQASQGQAFSWESTRSSSHSGVPSNVAA